jgi:adenylate cyclase
LESYFITTPDAYADAREMFEKAITLDPNYADAYATLAFLHFVTYLWQWDAYPRALDHAEELAGKAISLDSSNASAYAIRGWIAALRNRSYEAIADGQRAVALEPSNALACSALADIFNIARKPEEALAYAQRGLRLDPGHPEGPLTEEGFAYSQMGRYRESINALRGGQANNPWIHLEQVYNYSELGREQDARAELAQVLRLAPKFSLETVRKRLQGHWDNAAGERYLGDLSNAGLK